MQNLNDEDVMLSYKQGQGAAMDEILRRYKNPVLHFAYRLCHNTAEAEDIAQEVFLRVHQYRSTYVPSGKFSTWIFGIAHNLFVSRWRRERKFVMWPRKPDEPDAFQEVPNSDPSPHEQAVANETVDILKNCIQSLPFLQKEALILREYHGLDYAEIAKILNKNLGTIKTLIHRARMALKDRMVSHV
jgi:RNA polymerase sigma-70 factor, ECF subfamily